MSVAGFVAEVYGRCGDGSWSCGSGFAVGGRLVLTAGHVVVESGRPMTPVRVRLLGAADFVAAEVCWSGLGVGVDVALLRVTEADWAAPARRRPVRWGRLVGTAPGVPCTAVGFPAVQAAPDGVRDSEQAAGRINPLAMAKTGLHAITVDGPPHRVVASGSPWKGMSGAAVFCQDLLTAVVVQDPAGFASHRLVAVPIAAFADDAGFAEVLQSEIGADVMLEPVEVAGLFAEPPEVVSPASLLRADVAAVRFRGRVELLEELADWCQRPEWFLVRLVVGPGGQGKTRLGDELVQRMRRQGWVAGRVIDGAPASAQAALSGLACDVLLVVDYAETRAGQVQTLVERLRAANVRSRLVLLARSAGEWVGELTSRSADLAAVDAATVDDLPPVETSAAGRVEAWREAVRT